MNELHAYRRLRVIGNRLVAGRSDIPPRPVPRFPPVVSGPVRWHERLVDDTRRSPRVPRERPLYAPLRDIQRARTDRLLYLFTMAALAYPFGVGSMYLVDFIAMAVR